jgi:hypothetical protein
MGGQGSGGARSRSGPAPDRSAVRRGRQGDHGIHLPAEGRQGETPDWPLNRPTKFEREVWEREWRRPQAVMWERRGWEVQVALYVRTLRQAASVKASAGTTTNLLRQMVNLGLTDDGLARNGWVIDDGPAPAAPRRPATSTAKDRIRLIQGGADAAAS